MRAVVRTSYGTPHDVVRCDDIDVPGIKAGEVLLDVRAAGVDRGLLHLATGLPYPLRLAGYGVRAPKNPVLGREVAGTVVAVGEAVTEFEVGDDVMGVAEGSFAQRARAAASKLALKPRDVTFAAAAATTISALTALQGVREHGGVRPGDAVLILGASGGVGSFAVQIAKWLDAEVTAVASAGKLDFVRRLGADHLLDYACDALADSGRRYDVIIDIAGNRSLRTLRRSLTERGTLVIQGGETGGRWLDGTDRQLRALALSPFVGQKLRTFICSENAEDLGELASMLESGQLRPAIDRSFPLENAPEAIDHLLAGHTRGKLVIDVRDADHA